MEKQRNLRKQTIQAFILAYMIMLCMPCLRVLSALTWALNRQNQIPLSQVLAVLGWDACVWINRFIQ